MKQLPKDHLGRTLSDIWHDAGVETTAKEEILTFGEKVFIPKTMRRELLQTLHSTHQGEDCMFRTIRGIWVWPGMRHSVQQYVAQCPQCAEHARGKPAQPPQDLPESMLEVGPMDRFGH